MTKYEKMYNDINIQVNNVLLDDEEIYDPKYGFLKWAFETIDETSPDELELVMEEFKALDVSIDGFYTDLDGDEMILIVCDYYSTPTIDYEIEEARFVMNVRKLTNFMQKVYDRKYSIFGTTSLTYEIADRISNSDKKVLIYYYSNLNIPLVLQEDNIIDIKGRSLIIRFIGLDDIIDYNQNADESISINFEEVTDNDIDAIKVSSTKDFDVYLFVLPGYLLGKLYDKHGLALLDSNVRSYLKKSQKVNKGIWQTINDAPSEFVAYNNGLSTVAINGEIKKIKGNYCKIHSLEDWQIVNGGQTTATVHEALRDKLDLKDVLVPVKLTIIKNIQSNFDLIQSISLYANTQTAINKSDLSSNEPYYIELDRLSRKILWQNQYHLFFERNRGQYLAYQRRSKNAIKFKKDNPPKYKFTKTDIAKSVVSWQCMPHIVALGREKNFVFFNDHVRNQIIDIDENYYRNIVGAIILFHEVDKIVRMQKLEFKANVVSYTIAKISYELDMHLDLTSFWETQKLSQDLIEVIYKTTVKVRDRLVDSPPNFKNIPMWARKEECWDSVKKLQISPLNYLKSTSKINFFPVNEAQIYIEDIANFKDESTWTKLILWNSSTNILSNKQMGMIKRIESSIRFQKTITERQKKYAIDIFLLSVKQGFNYKG